MVCTEGHCSNLPPRRASCDLVLFFADGAGDEFERAEMFFASLIRLLLVVLAGFYVWKAMKRAIWGGSPKSTPQKDRSQRSFDGFEDPEDIDFEDIE